MWAASRQPAGATGWRRRPRRFNRPTHYRAITTRHDETAQSDQGVIDLATLETWL